MMVLVGPFTILQLTTLSALEDTIFWHITNLGKGPNSKLSLQFLPHVHCLHTIIKLRNCVLNYPGCGYSGCGYTVSHGQKQELARIIAKCESTHLDPTTQEVEAGRLQVQGQGLG